MEICYHGDTEPNRKSCCSRKMERRMHVAAEKDFYEVIRSTSSYLKNLLSSNAAKYQGKYKTVTLKNCDPSCFWEHCDPHSIN